VTRLAGIKPRFCITVGNQMDLTIGDYLQYLQTDSEVKVVGVYVEGFTPLDGIASLEAIGRMTTAGVTVILYRAGRTQAGAAATASHTASMAGDYTVTRQLARAAGAIVADTLDDFTDLVSLFTMLGSKPVSGRRLGALSNAGYECVAIADSIGDLELASFTSDTNAKLAALFDRSRLAAVVDVHNPLDLTPMMNDEGYEIACRYLLGDEHVDVGVIGCVPATPALNTLPASPVHGEDIERQGSLAARLIRLAGDSRKPWISIVDAGTIYDPFALKLQAGGVPTFRSADRALRLLNVFIADRLATFARVQTDFAAGEIYQPAR
jgi:acyl-CoA synthetase (NDP forming)